MSQNDTGDKPKKLFDSEEEIAKGEWNSSENIARKSRKIQSKNKITHHYEDPVKFVEYDQRRETEQWMAEGFLLMLERAADKLLKTNHVRL